MAFAAEHPVLAQSEFRPVGKIERREKPFEVVSEFEPSGDQPTAIAQLDERLNRGERDVVLMGATGTGKSATAAWLIEKQQRPTLVMAPNKTLAAQLANELRQLLPNNAVEYFVSYYDYYQPEAYIAQTDTYIEKDSSINDDVERLRHSATSALLSRRDVVVVSSVSCIYGLGTPQSYLDRSIVLRVGEEVERDRFLRLLVSSRSPNSAQWGRLSGAKNPSRSSPSLSPPATSPRRSRSWTSGSTAASATSCSWARPVPVSPPPPRGSLRSSSAPRW